MDSRQLRDVRLQALIERFADEGLLGVQGRRLRFADEESRFYVNGGWLEEHVYDTLRALRGELSHIQDLARSVDIVRETTRDDEVPNEIDVACLADNRLYLIEGKTRAWSRGGSASPGANALYRLDTLGDLLGGLHASAMLVSYRGLPAHVLRPCRGPWCPGVRRSAPARARRRAARLAGVGRADCRVVVMAFPVPRAWHGCLVPTRACGCRYGGPVPTWIPLCSIQATPLASM